jgi:transcriptional regulator NrdR family protein
MPDDERKIERDTRTEGIQCPRCGCRHMYVVYTRQRAKRILRVRECRYCGRRLKTYEQALG